MTHTKNWLLAAALMLAMLGAASGAATAQENDSAPADDAPCCDPGETAPE